MSTPPENQKKHPEMQRSGVVRKPYHWRCFILMTAGHLESARKRATILAGSKPVTQSSKSSLSIWNGSTQRIFNLTQLEKTGRSPSCSPQLPICRQEHRGLTHSQTQTSI